MKVKHLIMGLGRKCLRQLRPFLSDKTYVKCYYWCKMGKHLDLEHPHSFNEKLQWLKFNDIHPEYTAMVDKIEAKKYVASVLDEEIIIPTIGVYNSVEEINWSELPNQFVLKCSHDSGGIAICKDKKKFNINAAQEKLKRGLSTNYYKYSMEYPYKSVSPRILTERFMSDQGADLFDYKIHCFNGEPKVILVCKDRFSPSGLTEDFFTTSWEHLPIKRPLHPNSADIIPKPKELNVLLDYAKRLSHAIPFVRVDFYIANGHVYFSEMTFFPASGFTPFVPDEWDSILGDWLQLPSNN